MMKAKKQEKTRPVPTSTDNGAGGALNRKGSIRSILNDGINVDVKASTEFNPSAKDQSLNKAVFRKKYGFETEFPYFYILDAKVSPLDQTQILRVGKYAIPFSDAKVRTCKHG